MNEKLITAMLTRKSVRNYNGQQIPEDKIKVIKEFIADESNYVSPYGSKVRFELIEDGNVETKKLITGAPAFVVAIIENNNKAILDSGYVCEKLILFLESLGLGTCYLNSGFKRESVQLKQPLKDNEVMIISSPIGYEGGKKSIKAKGCDIYLKRDKRKSIDEMFFKDKEKNPITDEVIRKKLEYLVWAPSGLNSQPWRIVFDNDKAHFYIDKKIAVKKRVGFDIHYFDMGIILQHYALAFGKNEFTIEENMPVYDDMVYIMTVS